MKKTVLITGASSGFGAACARKFRGPEFRLILAARRLEKLEIVQRELSDTEILVLQLDVRDRKGVTEKLAALPVPFQEIDILVNNAGLALGLEPAQEADLDNWEIMVDTNIKGLIYCTRQILPGMVKRQRGHIVNIGSVAGSTPYPGGNVYGATKAFVQQFSNNLRSDLLGNPIRVTNIEPGLAETEFSLVRFNWDEERAADVYRGTRPLTAEDIAETVYWVTSLPPHININRLEVMPVCQAWAPFSIHRQEE
ncbi:MAG: SDR family oxidoreductase [Deltaproteobacteria bacterium]|jgi:NADP-dependent 3-hydroxy acid dehydrogenase YdfG|nr:SDR family oxidoreductase [Deltaproteobacteria bacterium]